MGKGDKVLVQNQTFAFELNCTPQHEFRVCETSSGSRVVERTPPFLFDEVDPRGLKVSTPHGELHTHQMLNYEHIFGSLPRRVYANPCRFLEARKLFDKMPERYTVEFAYTVINACSDLCAIVEGKPDLLIACVRGGSNARGLFHEFVDDKDIRLIDVEAAGIGLDSGTTAAAALSMCNNISKGKKRIFVTVSNCHPQTTNVGRTRAADFDLEEVTVDLKEIDYKSENYCCNSLITAKGTEEVVLDAVGDNFASNNSSRLKKINKGSGSIPIGSGAREMASILDNALPQALLLTGQSSVAEELLRGHNYCDLKICEKILQEGSYHVALVELYKCKSMHREALKLVHKLVEELKSSQSEITHRFKPETIIAYLKALCETEPILVLEFSMLVLVSQALSLFCHHAFGQKSIPFAANENLVTQVVAECGRLPLTLKVIGASLRDQTEMFWLSVKNRFSQGQSIGKSHEINLIDRMAISINYLLARIKECFLDLCSFPEDKKIPLDVLIDMWVEIHDIDEAEAFAIVVELSNKNLLTLVKEARAGGMYSSCFEISVTQHAIQRGGTIEFDWSPAAIKSALVFEKILILVIVAGHHFGNASGMAPRSHIAVYKAFYKGFGGFAADVVAAIDQAAQDGVANFINPIDMTLLSAVTAGIFVMQAAGKFILRLRPQLFAYVTKSDGDWWKQFWLLLRRAWKLLKGAYGATMGKEAVEGAVNFTPYNSVLAMLGKKLRAEDMIKVLCDMKLNGCVPNRVTWNTMLAVCGDKGKHNYVNQVLKEMKNCGFEPDKDTFNTLISAYGRCGSDVDAAKVYGEMVRAGFTNDL